MITFPTVLTLTRLIGALFFLPIILMTVLPHHNVVANLYVLLFFVALGLTDFFDGYYARVYNQETLLGKILDPLADKVFVTVTLVALVSLGSLGFYWAILFICRDFFVMGLREIALHKGFSVPVAYTGKVKTAVQMLFLGFSILNPYDALGWQAPWWNGCEFVLLSFALFLALVSAYFYYKNFRLKLLSR